MSKPSFVQPTLRAATSAGKPSFSCVMGAKAGRRPATIRGACSKSSSTEAATAPSVLNAKPPSFAVAADTGARHSKRTLRACMSMAATPVSAPASTDASSAPPRQAMPVNEPR
jgi:hypothetical protein